MTDAQLTFLIIAGICAVLFAGINMLAPKLASIARGDSGPRLSVSVDQINRRIRSLVDDIGSITFTADPAYHVALGQITLKLSGSAVADGSTPFSVQLKSLTGASAQTCTPGAGNSCSVTFSPTYSISAGKAKTVKVRIDSTNFPDTAGMDETLSLSVVQETDVTWNDGVSSDILLERAAAPLVISQAVY